MKASGHRILPLVAIAGVAVTLWAAPVLPQSDEQLSRKLGVAPEIVLRIRNERALSAPALDAMPVALVPNLVRRLEYPDLPARRAAFRALQEQNAEKIIPADARFKAFQQLQLFKLRTIEMRLPGAGLSTQPRVKGSADVVPLTAGLKPDHAGWKWLGPSNVGGRTRAVVIHQARPDRIWLASAGGGIWRSDNAGTNFVPADDLMANLAVSALVVDPTNPDVLYAGTGEGFFNADSIRGAGIFVTRDGVSWQQIASSRRSEFTYVNRLAMSSDGKSLLAATNSGLFLSSDPERKNWQPVLRDMFADVDFHPSDPRIAVAGTLRSGRAYYSRDGGATWTLATGFGAAAASTVRVELAFAAKDPNIVYASVATNRSEIWRSNDAGKNYTRRRNVTSSGAPANYLGAQGWYDNVIWAGDPGNADFVIVGGIDLWRSNDGGDTLVDISTWWSRASAHADQHAIVAHPKFDGRNNKAVYFANDGGLYKTDDVYRVGGDKGPPRDGGWIPLNNGYGTTQFYAGAANSSAGVVIGGAQDNGTLGSKLNAPAGWKSLYGGDGGWVAVDPAEPNFVYGEYINLDLHRSVDGGASESEPISGRYWDPAVGAWRWKSAPYRIPDAGDPAKALFIAPFVLDSNDPTRLLAGGESLWRTKDARAPNSASSGPSWYSIKPPTATKALISAIAIAQGRPDMVWVGHVSGEIYQTTNGLATSPDWGRVGATSNLPARYVTSIALQRDDPRVAYVTYGGYSTGNVWATGDGGVTWRNLGARLPEAPIRSLAIHPAKPKFLYVGTEVGIFASEDGGATWGATHEGPTSAAVDHLFWTGKSTLVAVTHGRGMFSIDLP